MPSENEKREAIDRLAQRIVEQSRDPSSKKVLTHEQARKDAIRAAVRNDRRNN